MDTTFENFGADVLIDLLTETLAGAMSVGGHAHPFTEPHRISLERQLALAVRLARKERRHRETLDRVRAMIRETENELEEGSAALRQQFSFATQKGLQFYGHRLELLRHIESNW